MRHLTTNGEPSTESEDILADYAGMAERAPLHSVQGMDNLVFEAGFQGTFGGNPNNLAPQFAAGTLIESGCGQGP